MKSTNLLILSSYYRNRAALSCTSGITESRSFTQGLSLTRSLLSIIYRIGDKLHSVRVGRRYKEVLENGREMCVFFATLAGTGPFSFALDLISISSAAARHFTGIHLSMDQLFFYFRGGLLQGPRAVFRDYHTESLKNSSSRNEPSADSKVQSRIYTQSVPGRLILRAMSLLRHNPGIPVCRHRQIDWIPRPPRRATGFQ